MTIQQEMIELFERAGFKVTLRNNDTHMVLDHESGRLQISHWPTTNKWMAWGRVWERSTPEQIMAAYQVGRLSMPREIMQTVTQCRKCHGSVWWAKTTKGKKMMINCDGSRHGGCGIVQPGLSRAPH